jgi:hypothetical protein
MNNHNVFYETVDKLRDYMLYEKTINNFDKRSLKKNKEVEKKNIVSLDNIFFPKEKDQLFWCFYILQHGMENYHLITNKYSEEKKTKIKIAESLKENKNLFKPSKISRHIVENELVNDKRISMKTIHVLCYIYKINIIYIKNSTYYEIITDEDKPFYLINEVNNEFGCRNFVLSHKLEHYKENFWKLENIGKPLKAISNYKTGEIKEIAERLKIDLYNKNQTKKTKKDLYENILDHLI